MSQREVQVLRLVEAALLTFVAATLLVVRDLPLVDLPQHAWQLASWLRIDSLDPRVRHLELHFRTPYLLAYPVARALAELVSVATALKLTFAASLVAQTLTLRRLCQRLGHEPCLGLLAVPLGLGYGFCFGFVAFCAALPLVYLAFSQFERHRQAPSLSGAVTLACTLSLLLVAHGVALGFLLVVLGPVLLVGRGPFWLRLAPLAGPPLLGLVWLVPGGTSTRLGGDLWRFEPERLLELPGQLVGIGAADHAASVLGVALLVVVGAHLGRPREWPLLYPIVAALLGYLLFPSMFRGAGPLHPRFATYLVPALLLGFAPRAHGFSRRRTGQLATLSLAVLVPAIFALRLPSFNREMDDFRQVLAEMRPNLRVRPLVFDRTSRAYPGIAAFLHVPAYYAAEKGGDAGYTFAMYSISVVRLRPGARVQMGGGAEWAPEWFDAKREAADYDYFLVRSSTDRAPQLFPVDGPRVALTAHVGAWWLYQRPPKPMY